MTQSSFGDWRIRLGIVLGILVFCFWVVAENILYPGTEASVHAPEAWWTIRLTMVCMLGAAVLSDKLKGQ